MTRSLKIQPLADHDIDQIAQHIAGDNIDAALRFLNASQLTFGLLCDMPLIGVSCLPYFKTELAKQLRLWRVKGFSNYQILYRVTDEHVVIVRVLHAARDFSGILEPN